MSVSELPGSAETRSTVGTSRCSVSPPIDDRQAGRVSRVLSFHISPVPFIGPRKRGGGASMGGINLGRVVLGGLLAGLVIDASEYLLNAVVLGASVSATDRIGLPFPPGPELTPVDSPAVRTRDIEGGEPGERAAPRLGPGMLGNSRSKTGSTSASRTPRINLCRSRSCSGAVALRRNSSHRTNTSTI